jgi:tetratricopeptide (TPR) repeat protein
MKNWFSRLFASAPVQAPTDAPADDLDLFEQAQLAQQTGQTQQAQRLYEQLLQLNPEHVEAMHLLGLLLAQQGRLSETLTWFERAVRIEPENVAIQTNLGNVYKQLGDLSKALMHYEHAIALNPQAIDAHVNRSAVMQELGRHEEAIASCNLALDANPKSVAAHFNKGNSYLAMKHFDQAAESYEQAIICQPDFQDAYVNLGSVWMNTQNYERALLCYRRFLAINPVHAQAHAACGFANTVLKNFEQAVQDFNLAIGLGYTSHDVLYAKADALMHLKRAEEAFPIFQELLKGSPNFSPAYNALSDIYYQRQDWASALFYANKAIEFQADFALAYNNRGAIFAKMGDVKAARLDFDKSIALDPNDQQVHVNSGALHQANREIEAAMTAYRRALEIDPKHAQAYSNLGTAYETNLDLDKAIDCYDKALALDHSFSAARMNKSLTQLLMGNLHEGWINYETRWGHTPLQSSKKRTYVQPQWTGEQNLKNKKIFVYWEQGLGDTIQFVRYVPWLAALGAHVVLEVQAPVHKLMMQVEGVSLLITQEQTPGDFDFHCPLLSLPLAFKTQLNTVPAKVPYLRAQAQDVQRWGARLGGKTKPRVGVVWSGNKVHANDHNRSISLLQVMTLFAADVNWVCLQKEIRADEQQLAQSCEELALYEAHLNDFTETAALIEQLDLVISVDTSVAHLAAAMGKPTWILLPYCPDWRWLLGRGDSPWYPGVVRLYRQGADRQWAPVLEQVKKDLMAQLLALT